jgi:hypothetical protein
MLGVAVDARRLHLADYFAHWWDAPAAQKTRFAKGVVRILEVIQRRGLDKSLGVCADDGEPWQALARR